VTASSCVISSLTTSSFSEVVLHSHQQHSELLFLQAQQLVETTPGLEENELHHLPYFQEIHLLLPSECWICF